jgi:hypothetical protein
MSTETTYPDNPGMLLSTTTSPWPGSLFKMEGIGASIKVGLDQKTVRRFKQRFGKTLIFTDRKGLSAVEITQPLNLLHEILRLKQVSLPSAEGGSTNIHPGDNSFSQKKLNT